MVSYIGWAELWQCHSAVHYTGCLSQSWWYIHQSQYLWDSTSSYTSPYDHIRFFGFLHLLGEIWAAIVLCSGTECWRWLARHWRRMEFKMCLWRAMCLYATKPLLLSGSVHRILLIFQSSRSHCLGFCVYCLRCLAAVFMMFSFNSFFYCWLILQRLWLKILPSVLWRCWLGGRKGIRPVKNWVGAGMAICLERSADLHMVQLMPLPLTVSCFSEIQIGFTFLVPAHPGSPGQRAFKWVCVWFCKDIRRRTLIGIWMSVTGSHHATRLLDFSTY